MVVGQVVARKRRLGAATSLLQLLLDHGYLLGHVFDFGRLVQDFSLSAA